MASIEVKIKKLDGELARYKEQMSKLRNGAGKVCYVSVATGRWGRTTVLERYPRTRHAYIEAEKNVRITTGAVNTANIQHGVCCARHGESPQYDGHC